MKPVRTLLYALLVLGLISITSFSSYADDDYDDLQKIIEKAEEKTEKALKKARKDLDEALEELEDHPIDAKEDIVQALEKARERLRKAQKKLPFEDQDWQSIFDDLLVEYQAHLYGYEYAEEPDTSGETQFQFAFIGDTPYARDLEENFGFLTNSVNNDADISFSIHIGDIKSGSTECSDERLNLSKNLLDQFLQPLIYTPGDNDWTDCHRASNGFYLPTERLTYIRETFFYVPAMSLGQNPMALTSQADDPMSAHVDYKENVMWSEKNVMFATFNVTGSRNNLLAWTGLVATTSEGCVETHTDCGVADSFLSPRLDRLDEFKAREQAALDWLDQVFAAADSADSPAVVLAFQANPNFEMERYLGDRQGFNNILDRIEQLTRAFNKPVLLLHGDPHLLLIDHPISVTADNVTFAYTKFLRIQSYGSPDLNWLKISVDTAKKSVFSIEIIEVEETVPALPVYEAPDFYDAPMLPVPTI